MNGLMFPSDPSTLLLTILLAVGLIFFLRAASKDRTTVVDIHSPLPALIVLEGLGSWLEERGWRRNGGDAERQTLRFRGEVGASLILASLLSALGGLGAACLGLVLRQLQPALGWWPLFLLLLVVGPFVGWFYIQRAHRMESVELQLLTPGSSGGSTLKLRAHRDELIALELALGSELKLSSDGSLLSSPI